MNVILKLKLQFELKSLFFLGGHGQLDLQAVENGGEGAQVRHQAAIFRSPF